MDFLGSFPTFPFIPPSLLGTVELSKQWRVTDQKQQRKSVCNTPIFSIYFAYKRRPCKQFWETFVNMRNKFLWMLKFAKMLSKNLVKYFGLNFSGHINRIKNQNMCGNSTASNTTYGPKKVGVWEHQSVSLGTRYPEQEDFLYISKRSYLYFWSSVTLVKFWNT